MTARLLLALLLATLSACSAEIVDDGDPIDERESLPNGEYQNPVLGMVERPAGVPVTEPGNVPGHPPTEGCPDPQGLRGPDGKYYLYCTSYTFKYGRYNGFPIFMASAPGGPYHHVGQLIPNVGAGRQSWPNWIRDASGKLDGDFWGPDVHELPNGKFLAAYSAPCGSARCVGIAWSDHPAGPWTHAGAPYIGPHDNGAGGGNCYDPNLLVTSQGELYLYWVVVGRGVYGVQVHAQPSGRLDAFDPADAKLIADRALGQRGEGPYVVEHGGAFYELYSTGSLFYSYYVGVRRGISPLAHFDEEGPAKVVQPNAYFDATGGNSLMHDPVTNQDILVYHGIPVPKNACPRLDPVYGFEIQRDPVNNPHCRVQGDRQAMIDPIEWKAGPDGIEWPVLVNGTGSPSIGPTRL